MRVEPVSKNIWEIPATEKKGMNVPARIYATENLLHGMDSAVFEQITNVACMPGIVKYALAMPDAHSGYGSPVGGVAAFDPETGVISPGVIGFDILCGMRLIKTNLNYKEVKPKIKQLVNELFETVPAGVGVKGSIRLQRKEVIEVMENGAKWCHENGYAWKQDLERIEEKGCLKGADARNVSDKAIGRSMNQLGTLGSGNHYLEVQVIHASEIYNSEIANKFGVFDDGQAMIMIHCGSRGTGHQIATDYMQSFGPAMEKYGLKVKDRELACAPFSSEEGRKYYSAMACAANNAFANRQVITHNVRKAFGKVFGKSPEDMEMDLIYDVAHNIAKVERHNVDGMMKDLVVHRKGSTRSFGPESEELAPVFRKTGQPVIVGGSMETGSYVCAGTEKAMLETFGSTMHGSGRTMSRTKAKELVKGEKLQRDMEERGIYVKSASYAGLAEEAGIAYKDISEVVRTMDEIGISKKVFSLKPIGNVKG
ncbi:MAG: RtcB family protein [Candidatus Diapherotrites archaeon]|uniref:tRNA-splicing ligase RtcB n=1 Tax=Candidatus Iainarchaeum sp. TaxID=3101447 RepID=A0A8T3YLM7_9ARCH|nr:RtcB family protein [Candidatus Diapherotrites archaeon]